MKDNESDKLTPKQFDLFREFIYRHSGIRMDTNKITLATNRIRRRMRANAMTDFDAYYALLTSRAGGAELECFLDAVTTNETSFFRTNAHFEWFKDQYIPELVAREQRGEHGKHLRVWSAACSTGEEPYSIAICIAESALRLRDWKLSVLGTDLSETVLRDARAGVYKRKTVIEDLPDARVKRHFEATPGGETFTVRSHIRDLVEFRRHNLMNSLHTTHFDCIFIRNVLIYFDRDSKQVVIKHLIQALARGGYLVVGPSEGIYDMLEPLVKKNTFLYQKP